MAATTTTISVEGDRAFVSKLKKLAVLREQTVGENVRAALDQVYGAELEHLATVSFFAAGDASTHQDNLDAAT
ncbi:MAG: hypothetical protein IPK17_38720 [Chloroflexi bacterium]|uniref:hypothetical protein n=1 Tax=Candidatus Flexifilum breve TaxID=3140694 RepID=UPI0031368793|nr:hypothetical protein [Chloroflexota bacterium]